MFVISIVAVISKLCVVTVNKWPNTEPFSAIMQFFSRALECPGVTRTPRLGIAAVEDDGACSFSFASTAIFVWSKVVCIVSQYKGNASEQRQDVLNLVKASCCY